MRAGGSDHKLYDGSDFKAYLLMGGLGSDVASLVMPTCLEKADLLALLCDEVFCVLVTFPYVS